MLLQRGRIVLTCGRFSFNLLFFGSLLYQLVYSGLGYFSGSVAGLPLTSSQWLGVFAFLAAANIVMPGLVARLLLKEYRSGVVKASP